MSGTALVADTEPAENNKTSQVSKGSVYQICKKHTSVKMKHTESAESVLLSATRGAVSKVAIPIGTSESVYQHQEKQNTHINIYPIYIILNATQSHLHQYTAPILQHTTHLYVIENI